MVVQRAAGRAAARGLPAGAALVLGLLLGPGAAPAQQARAAGVAPAAATAREARPAGCPVTAPGVHVLVSPVAPREGEPLRVLAGTLGVGLENGKLEVRGPRGLWRSDDVVTHAEAPSVLVGSVVPRGPGRAVVRVLDARGCVMGCTTTVVARADAPRPDRALPADVAGAWPVRAAWDERHETLFAAWIAHLFYVEPGAHAGWRPLHQVLRDPARNALYDLLGLEEESATQSGRRAQVRADCADTLYALRAYFAWKLGLPVALHQCARGDARRGPDCRGLVTNTDAMPSGASRDRVRRFSQFNARVASIVMSGTTRTLPDDEEGDFYPIALNRQSLRPGTVFVNPNGHVLMVSQWTRQRRGRFGALFAVDGHPGFSVTHKAFTPELFPFVAAVDTGGFKMFRPAVLDGDHVRPMTDREIAARRYLPRRSVDQASMTDAQFYARLGRLQNPRRLAPVQAARDAAFYLHSVARERARLVDRAPRRFDDALPQRFYSGFGAPAAWRRHATARLDLRLLLAIDQVRELPALARRGSYPLTGPAGEAEVRAALQEELAARSVTYRASDRSTRTLTLAQLVERRDRFTAAFHPAECAELRWGAADRSDEQRTCDRRLSRASEQALRRAAARFVERWEPNDR